MTLVLQPLPFLELVGLVIFSIFTIFIAIRLWSYAYFKSKWQQYTDKVKQMQKLL
jgi:hypothetical protein